MSLRIKAFRAFRPDAKLVDKVASVPYDVCNREEAVALAKDNPVSFLHVVRPDIDLPADVSPYDDRMYDTAAANLQRFIKDKVLVQESAPALYLYRQQMNLLGNTVSQTGVVACCHIDDYNNDLIKKHEKTRQQKEDDRTRHVKTLNANTGPVFLMHKAASEVEKLKVPELQRAPVYDFTAPDGVTHTVWKVENVDGFVSAFAKLNSAYVADGHHRSASAARAGAERRAANPNHTGAEEYNWFLCVLFAADELSILPYYRVVQDLAGQTPEAFVAALGKVGKVEATKEKEPKKLGQFCVFVDKQWYRVTFPEDSIDRKDPIASLDCELLYQRVLKPLLKIGDIRTDPRVDFVGGIRGTGALEDLVNSGKHAVAFSMFPVTTGQLMAVADSGAIMPPKTTWFEPKLRSGLLVHTLD